VARIGVSLVEAGEARSDGPWAVGRAQLGPAAAGVQTEFAVGTPFLKKIKICERTPNIP